MAVSPTSGELDRIWIDAAARLGIPVERGGPVDAYVHWDGSALHIAADAHLDADDTVAQLILHEICHALVQGPANFRRADWGLDNTHDGDLARELAAVRVQAHLTGAFALRGVLFPTTSVRSFFEALPGDAFAPLAEAGGFSDGDSAAMARIAALRAAQEPFGMILRLALLQSAHESSRPLHPKSELPLADSALPAATCGTCVWRSAGGVCRKAPRRVRVGPADAACAGFEGALDCLPCGACCRSAYDLVAVGLRDPFRRLHPELVERAGDLYTVRRARLPLEQRCAAIDGPEGGPYPCGVYADRPRVCRDFPPGGRHCLVARRKVGLSV